MTTRRKKNAGTVPATTDPPAVGDDTPAEESSPTSTNLEPGIAWGNVIRDTLKVGNPVALAARLRAELRFKSEEERTSYAAVLQALDRAAGNYDDAYLLYRVAKLEDQRFELDCRERLEVMRTAALEALMSEYKEKKRKSPTNDDIEDRMLACWPDEYRHIKGRKNELHAAMRSLEHLAKSWDSRCKDLRTMADMIARKKG